HVSARQRLGPQGVAIEERGLLFKNQCPFRKAIRSASSWRVIVFSNSSGIRDSPAEDILAMLLRSIESVTPRDLLRVMVVAVSEAIRPVNTCPSLVSMS